MRICFLLGSFPSLSETFVLNQITGLINAGHQVDVCAGVRSKDGVAHPDVMRYGLMRRVKYYHDKPRFLALRVLKFLFMFPWVCARAPQRVLCSLDVRRYGREALSLNLFFKVAAFLDVKEHELVLCHFGPSGLVGQEMKDMGVIKGKLVVFFHASDITAYVRRFGHAVYKDLFNKADRVLAISHYARQRLIEFGCPVAKILVHPMGVTVTDRLVPEARPTPDGMLRILSVARLVEKKGISWGLEAVALLRREGIPCTYTIIGDGPLRPALEEKASALKIREHIVFKGWQDSVVVHTALEQADVLLSPSILAENGDEEGVPVILMEAMAAGLPVITTLTGGTGELVVSGNNGLVVPPRDAPAIADQLRRIHGDRALAASLVAAGRDMVKARHDIGVLNARLADIFKEVVHGGNA